MNVIVRLPHRRSGESQKQEPFLAPSADKQPRNYDVERSNNDPSLLTLRPKGLRQSNMKWWATHTNIPVDVIVRLPHLRSGESKGKETFLAPSAEKQTCNYNIECSNHHPSLSTLRPKALSCSKIKWWAIYTNLPIYVIVRLPHPRNGDSQGQETCLAPSADKQTRNYDIECSNHHPSLSTLRSNGLSRSKIKWWAIHTNFAVNVIVRTTHPPSGDSRGKETFLPPSVDKQTRNYDRVSSSHHPSLSTLSPKGLSHRKIKWWAIHTKLPVDVIVRLSHRPSGEGHNQETFWAPTADKKTCNYDIECSNHHPSLSILRPKGLSRSKMKWWAIYTNLPMDVIVKLPHRWRGESQSQKIFLEPSADKQTRNYHIECLNHHPSLSTLRPKGLSHSKMKSRAIHIDWTVDVIVRLPHRRSLEGQNQ